MKPEFDTSKYERSHGKKPRGRGLWAFAPHDNPERATMITGTYADAKRTVQHFQPYVQRFVVLP